MADSAVNEFGAAPVAVADVVLRRYEAAREDNDTLEDDMSLMKLIKMAYVAHGYHLAFYGAPLIRERVQAWERGPVVPDIYYGAKAFFGNSGAQPLPPDLFWLPVRYLNPFEGFVADKSKEVVDAVIRAFGANSGSALSFATHREGTPWEQTYKKGQRLIDDKIIRDFYLERYKNADVASKGL